MQYSLNVLAFLLISHVEIRLTDRQERIASLQPENLTLNVKECVQTQCVFNIFNARRSESLHRHSENEHVQRLGALVRQRPRPRPGTIPAISRTPLPCHCGTLLSTLIEPYKTSY